MRDQARNSDQESEPLSYRIHDIFAPKPTWFLCLVVIDLIEINSMLKQVPDSVCRLFIFICKSSVSELEGSVWWPKSCSVILWHLHYINIVDT